MNQPGFLPVLAAEISTGVSCSGLASQRHLTLPIIPYPPITSGLLANHLSSQSSSSMRLFPTYPAVLPSFTQSAMYGWMKMSACGCARRGAVYQRRFGRLSLHPVKLGDTSRIAADQVNRITLALADLDAAGRPSYLDLPAASTQRGPTRTMEHFDFWELAYHVQI